MSKKGLTRVRSNSIISKTTQNIKLQYCMLSFGCLSNISCKFYQILKCSHLLNWHGITLLTDHFAVPKTQVSGGHKPGFGARKMSRLPGFAASGKPGFQTPQLMKHYHSTSMTVYANTNVLTYSMSEQRNNKNQCLTWQHAHIFQRSCEDHCWSENMAGWTHTQYFCLEPNLHSYCTSSHAMHSYTIILSTTTTTYSY